MLCGKNKVQDSRTEHKAKSSINKQEEALFLYEELHTSKKETCLLRRKLFFNLMLFKQVYTESCNIKYLIQDPNQSASCSFTTWKQVHNSWCSSLHNTQSSQTLLNCHICSSMAIFPWCYNDARPSKTDYMGLKVKKFSSLDRKKNKRGKFIQRSCRSSCH